MNCCNYNVNTHINPYVIKFEILPRDLERGASLGGPRCCDAVRGMAGVAIDPPNAIAASS